MFVSNDANSLRVSLCGFYWLSAVGWLRTVIEKVLVTDSLSNMNRLYRGGEFKASFTGSYMPKEMRYTSYLFILSKKKEIKKKEKEM